MDDTGHSSYELATSNPIFTTTHSFHSLRQVIAILFGVRSPMASTLVWPTPVQLCSFLNQVFTFMRLVLTRHPRMSMR